jgi:hypothetical protein
VTELRGYAKRRERREEILAAADGALRDFLAGLD